jgi:hypothetical protein
MLRDSTYPESGQTARATDAATAALVWLLGLAVRLPAVLQSSFPLNDGGLFYRMILDIQANGLGLPVFASYNSQAIPFAYPPLGLYAGAVLASVLHASVLDILRVVPGIVSSLCVPAFYFLARRVLKSSPYTVLAATIAFALTPRAFEWQIMGGGITRSFGLLFALLTWNAVCGLFETKSVRDIAPVAIWGALTILSHPEAAVQGLLGVVLLYVVLDRSRAGAFHAGLAAAIIALLTAPWWGTVLARYGTGPFVSAVSAARQGTSVDFAARIFLAFQFSFTEEPFLPVIAVLGLVGLFTELARRSLLLPLWVLVPLFLEPRSAPQYMVVPLGMLAGIGFVDVIMPAIQNITRGRTGTALKAARWFAVYLMLYMLLGAYLVSENIAARASLQPGDLAAFSWIRDNTPPVSRFVLLTKANALADPWVEWFPALTQRRSEDTVFGAEWLPGDSFGARIRQYDALQACLNQDTACLEGWKQTTGQQFEYVAVRITKDSAALLAALHASNSYKLVYENPNFAIFASPG